MSSVVGAPGPRLWSCLAAVAQRDLTKLVRDRWRLAVNLAFPVMLIVGFGQVLQQTFGQHGKLDAVTVAFTGVLAATMFQSTAAGMISIVEDRENDFSRQLFVAPINRLTLVGGKILGETAVALTQGVLIVVVAVAFGVRPTPLQLAALIGPALGCCLVGGAFGLATIAVLPNQRAAMQVFQFLIIPQYLLAGVVVPVRTLPVYLAVISWASPLRYGVDLTRRVFYTTAAERAQLVGVGAPLDLAVMGGLFVALMVGGTALFDHRERTR